MAEKDLVYFKQWIPAGHKRLSIFQTMNTSRTSNG